VPASFTELDKYLKRMEAEVTAVTTTVKQGKGRKVVSTEEDKKRKIKGSQGVEKLKKVNVNGMAKLSSFFKRT
jgi:ribonuclease H2 subunit B